MIVVTVSHSAHKKGGEPSMILTIGFICTNDKSNGGKLRWNVSYRTKYIVQTPGQACTQTIILRNPVCSTKHQWATQDFEEGERGDFDLRDANKSRSTGRSDLRCHHKASHAERHVSYIHKKLHQRGTNLSLFWFFFLFLVPSLLEEDSLQQLIIKWQKKREWFLESEYLFQNSSYRPTP